eukprot:1533129-Prymnesium_polylepis.1
MPAARGSRSEPSVAEAAAVRDGGARGDRQDNESLATENSDEEPLDGEPAAHVEVMLQTCLDPDERQDPDAWRKVAGVAHSDGSGAETEDEWDERLEAAAATAERGADDEAVSDEADSEAEDLEEAAALAEHSQTIRIG